MLGASYTELIYSKTDNTIHIHVEQSIYVLKIVSVHLHY
jgi:hypothetical protein